MTGPEFHEFLIRGSNDRLLTDRDRTVIDGAATSYFVDLADLYNQGAVAVSQGRLDDEVFRLWGNHAQFGFRRAPLELIAYVVENERQYTEILTADYIMANPMAAAAYGAPTVFTDPDDAFEFRPSEIVSYYRDDESKITEYSLELGTTVIEPGNLLTDYPHAGILNTTAFLLRYPTTATNRNRARARWTYYHFLGLDVEKSASRTTDPVALADTRNPTMHNPACKVCHSGMDPVAGAFQNYGDEGFYRDRWEGLDSLDELYKTAEGPTFTVQTESWRSRETLSWSVTLFTGVQTLRVMYPNHFWDDVAHEAGVVYLDRLDVTDAEGEVVVSQEFEDLEAPVPHWDGSCGEADASRDGGRHDHFVLWAGWDSCAFYIDVEIANDGVYDVEIVGWSDGWDERYEGDGFAELSVVANAYEEGDTWYSDMRIPGFAGEWAPHPDNSLQWLAQQIIADPRFAEATVKFWWPAIMGSEVVQPPEDDLDADFEGQLLAANHQNAEVARLAEGFREGFPGSPYTYNLKDLLAEITLSKWFRADAVTDADPVRLVALHDAGARRLLTPEELARKTAAITGVQWGRRNRTDCWPECNPRANALTDDYRLLYGGIDSGGVTQRARDMTSVMAGVAKLHAKEVSCLAVTRELFLLPDSERLLFAGIDRHTTPESEATSVFEIEADSYVDRETLYMRDTLAAGSKNIRMSFLNDYWDEVGGDRNVRLDRLVVRDAAGRVVTRYELEELEPVTDCNYPLDDHFAFHCGGSVNVPVEIATAGNHTIEIAAWADQGGDELPRLSIVVETTATDSSSGASLFRDKLVELHDKLFGVQVTPDSPDVEAAYRLFVELMTRGREAEDFTWFEWQRCRWGDDHFLFEGVLEDVIILHENEYGHTWHGFDGNRVGAFLEDVDFSDPHHTARAWMGVLAAMLMDYRYLFL